MKPGQALDRVNTASAPSDLRIIDMRFAEIAGAPMDCVLVRIETNQGIVGLGEVRDWGSRTYAAMLKGRLLGENPCDVDRLFRRIKQFGGPARQGGGVSGIEVALWDLAGKAYGVPVYQMLGGKFRDRVRLYCDTPDRPGVSFGEALRKRLSMGFTFLKMDVGIDRIAGTPGALNAPAGLLEARERAAADRRAGSGTPQARAARNRAYDTQNVMHPFTGIHVTERGLDELERVFAEARAAVGDGVPLAVDHVGHIGLEDCVRLARRLERYTPAWLEDALPWQLTEQYRRLTTATTVPICTGEDIYLKEGFGPLFDARAIAVAHPDVLTAGGILETKKIGDLAQEAGVAMAIHMAESPVGCMAAAHCAVATENFLALEFHSADTPWWQDIVKAPRIVHDGFVHVSGKPGLGIDDFNDDVLREHAHPDRPALWASTEEWDREWSHDRTWS
jgi:gluconate/galactonate dehydratase